MTVGEQLAAALSEVENLRMTIAEKDRIIQDLQNRLLWLRKKVFGPMSEKALPVDPAQLSLFDEKHLTGEERARLDREVEEAEKTITKTITVKARPLDTTGLPEKVFHIYPDRVLDGDGNLKAEYVEIGTDESSRLEKRPAEVYIHKDVFHKVILKSDIETKHPEDREILSSEYVQVDESVMPVIDNEKHKARKGYEWCVRDGITGDVMFWYDRGSRGHHVAREILGGYRGNVQCDGYEAYDQFERMPGITVHGCWAHVRRKFVDSLKENERLAMEGILFIRKLYKVESDADDKGLSAEERMEQRRKISYPTILMFEKWIEETYAKVLPKSRLGEALAYAYSLLPRLSRYVNDGRINIDNNLIENAIRPLALGRKNYLFCGNDASAYRAAIVYSLIGTCRAAGVDPRTWMEDVLSKLPYWQRDGKDLAGLLPRAWAKENQITPK